MNKERMLMNFIIHMLITICFYHFTCALAVIQGRYTDHITNYNIIIPRKVKRNGAFHSFNLPNSFSEHTRKKRSLNSKDEVHYKIQIGDEWFILDLKPNTRLTSPGLRVERHYSGSSSNLSCINFDIPKKHLCHYHGCVRGIKPSTTALSLCQGIVGFIKMKKKWFFIEPIKYEEPLTNGEHLHVIYKRSLNSDNGFCINTRDDWWNGWAEEIYRNKVQRALYNVKDPSLSIFQTTETPLNRTFLAEDVISSLGRYSPMWLEICLVSDLNFIAHHGHENAEEYLLTIMNMVGNYWHDSSIGILVDVSVVRMILLEKHKNEIDLKIVPKAENTLKSFCKWQMPLNPIDPDHPSHYDLAILVSRHDLCVSDTDGCNLFGLAYLATACNTKGKNCAIVEDTGLILAVTMAHEIGHNMGCTHDPDDSGCPEELADGTRSIMTSHLQLNSHAWSKCSRDFVGNLISSGLGDCLFDEPADHNYKSSTTPPGAIYNIEQQCRLSFGNDYTACPMGGDDICKKLWCKVPGSWECITKDDMVADGSTCGNNKWCYLGECVKEGERPNAIAGGWGEWSFWSDCSRTCGGGVRRRIRSCDNPQPVNGGAFCAGPKIEYEMCNVQDCDDNMTRFRELQCAEHNDKHFKGQKYTWLPAPPPESDPNPCALYCVNEKRVLAKLEPRVRDGTRCRPGSKDTCIHGICMKVGCDWKINSDVEEDICGVCGGDGTCCEIIKKTFKKTKGSGYVKIVDIPRGSKNIDIKQVGPGENILAFGYTNGTIYFNQNYTEFPPGEYIFGGVKGTYTKPLENREEIHVKGPLLEDATLYMCYFKDENPGVQYYYVIPTSVPVRVPKYHWEFVEWGSCSARCGGGTQVSKPICVEESSGKVRSSFCDNIPWKPEPQIRSCNTNKCHTRWKAWKWGPCSGCIYITGRKYRQVECVMESPKFGDCDEIIVNATECIGHPPIKWELCNSITPCYCKKSHRFSLNQIDEDLFKKGYYNYCYNLDGLDQLFYNQRKKHRIPNKGHGGNFKPGEIIKDNIDINNITLEVAKLCPCRTDWNLTEVDFVDEGDTVPSYVPDKIMGFYGKDAVLKLKKIMHSDTKISNIFDKLLQNEESSSRRWFFKESCTLNPVNTTNNWFKKSLNYTKT